jgi:hypothetical protein
MNGVPGKGKTMTLPGYETEGYPEYAAARAQGYPHARCVWEDDQRRKAILASQPEDPDATGKFMLSLVFLGGAGCGDAVMHYVGGQFMEVADTDAKLLSPDEAANVVSKQEQMPDVEYVLSRGDHEYVWNRDKNRWLKPT